MWPTIRSIFIPRNTISRRMNCVASAQSLLQQFIDDRRVRAFRLLHRLTDEEADHRGLARAILLDLLGIRGDDRVDDLLDRSCVGGLPRTSLFLVNHWEVLPPFETEVVKILEHLAADGLRFD